MKLTILSYENLLKSDDIIILKSSIIKHILLEIEDYKEAFSDVFDYEEIEENECNFMQMITDVSKSETTIAECKDMIIDLINNYDVAIDDCTENAILTD